MTESPSSTTRQRDLPAGTVTILFTDIQGSTDLLTQLGDDGYVALVSEHHKLMRQAITRHGGTEVRIQGDSFFVTFPRASDAVSAAVGAQRAIAAHTWPQDVQVLVRMGLHTGQPWVAVEDYEGIDIHRAARIASTGHGGQVLLSETTTSLVRDDLPQGVTLKDLGRHRLKDMRRAEQIYQLVIPGLPSDFPPIRSLESVPTLTRFQSLRGYELHQKLGEGVFGEVYLAYQPSVRRDVAIKTIVPKYANDPNFIRRFEAEAQVVASLEHPHIVPLYDYWREPDGAYLVMRYLRGGSLEDALSYGPWQGEYAVHLVDQVASALAYAHRQGVVHRDIKPANILLDEGGNAYLSDFGIATMAGSLQAQLELQALDGTDRALYSGSLGYQSPETADGKPATQLSDIYSLGVVLFQLVTAKPPFPDLSAEELIEAHRSLPLPPITELRPEIPAAVDAVIQKATAKDPALRYPDALQLAAAFKSSILAEALEAPLEMPLEVENPYKGLRAFQEADAGEFFGRAAMIQRLLGRLDAENRSPSKGRFLAVVGPSGSGKSSLVRAGLVPALRKGAVEGSDCWFILDMIPGAHPYEELEAALLRVAVNPPASLLEQLQSDERGLVRAVKRCLPPDEDIELLLVVDQFEELFTLVQDPEEARRFLDCLYAAVMDPASRVRVVITLRADFYDRPLMHPDFSGLVQEHTEVVVPLTSDELSEAVENPARSVGARLEPGLTARIVTDVHGEPGALPLLQYALTELFDHRDNGTLTQAAYQEIGGVLGALGKRAEDTYQELDGTAQSAARQLFLRLVTLGEGTVDTRRRVLRSELEALGASSNPTSEEDWSTAVDSVIGLFGGHRLLTFDRDPTTREPTVEVAHEALLREWSRLGGWLDESRADVRMQRVLGNAASEWVAAERDPSFLLRGARLEQYEGWAASTDLALTADERVYLDASLADEAARAEERQKLERRSRNVLRALVAVFAVAAVVAVVLSLIANEQRRLAVARELAMSANANLETDPELSALLAMQSISTTLTLEGVNALHRAMPELHTEKAFYFEGAQGEGAAISPDGTRLALTTINGDLIVVDISSGETLYTVTPQEELIPGTLKYSPDGSKIATSGPTAKADLTLYDADTGEVIRSWVSQPGAPMYIENVGGDIAFSPDGTRLAVANFNGYPHVMDVQSGDILLKLEGHQLVAMGLAYSPDGSMIATGDESVGQVIVWSASDGSQITSFQGGESGIYAIAFSPDSERLSAVGDDGLLNIWDIRTGDTILSQPSGTSGYRGVVFTPDGKKVITGGQDTTVRVWDANTGEQQQKIAGTGAIISHISLSPDGKYFATTIGTDHYARLWSLDPGTELYTLPGNSFAIGMLFSPDGEELVTAGKDGVINTWDPETGAPLGDFLRLPVEAGTIIGNLQYSPDGELIAAAHGPYTSLIVLDSKEITQTFEGHIGPVIDIAFSPDGDQMVSVGFDGKAIVFDTNTGEMITEYLEHGQWALGVAYTPDGDYVTTAGTGNSVFIWDPNTGETVNTLPVQSILTALEYSPDGKWLVVGDADGRMFIWDAETLEFYKEIQAHDSWITEIAFSQDGTRMGTSAFDTLAKVWEVPSFIELATLYGSKMNGGGVEFSPDGSVVVAGFWDETYRGYLVDPEDLIEFAQSRLTRSLTDVECQKFLHVESCP